MQSCTKGYSIKDIDLNNIAFKLSLQSLDCYQNREIELIEHLNQQCEQVSDINKYIADPDSFDMNHRLFLIHLEWILEKYLSESSFNEFAITNTAISDIVTAPEERDFPIQTSFQQDLASKVNIVSDGQEIVLPIKQTRVWPAEFLKIIEIIKTVKDRNHPIRLAYYAYQMIRKFIATTYNYSILFVSDKSELNINILERSCLLNRNPINQLHIAGQLHNKLFDGSVTQEMYELRKDSGCYKNGHIPLFRDQITSAELLVQTKTIVMDTPTNEHTVIDRNLEEQNVNINAQSICQTLIAISTIVTESSKYQIPFIQIRYWPANYPVETILI